MMLNQWKIPWEIEEIMEEISSTIQVLNATIFHIFREGNTVADSLENQSIETQG